MRALLLALSLALPTAAFADGITVHDPYVRASGPMAKAAAAFMIIHNDTENDVVFVAAESDAARKVELHTHIMEDNVAKMREIEGGITIPAGGMHALKRGADHVMLMGLTEKLAQDDIVTFTFMFKGADPMTLDIPVDNERKAEDVGMDHSEHKTN